MLGRLGVGICVFYERPFRKNQAYLNSLPFFLRSVAMIAVLSKSKLCPLWEVCACSNDALLCRRMAARCSFCIVPSFLPVSPT